MTPIVVHRVRSVSGLRANQPCCTTSAYSSSLTFPRFLANDPDRSESRIASRPSKIASYSAFSYGSSAGIGAFGSLTSIQSGAS